MDVPAQVPLRRKHTPRIMDELSSLVENALTKLDHAATEHTDRLNIYKETPIQNLAAHDIIVESMRQKIVPASYLPRITEEWHNPSIELFKDRDLYSLYNCYTEAFKKSPAETPDRTLALIRVFDEVAKEEDELWHNKVNEDNRPF
jgi:hypothetical protein